MCGYIAKVELECVFVKTFEYIQRIKESESEKGIQHLNTNWILALLLIKFTAFDPRFHVLAKPMMAPI